MIVILLVVVTYIVTLGLMVSIDWLTDGVIAEAFGLDYPARGSRDDA